MSDLLVKLARSAAETADELKLGTLNYALTECADALEAKDAEIKQLREQRDHECWQHAACLTIAETGERWGECVYPSLAMRKVLQLRQRNDDLLAEVHRQDAEIDRLRQEATHLGTTAEEWAGMWDVARLRADKAEADLRALAAAVMELPEYDEPDQSDVPPWLRLDFSHANAARAAARKLAGGE